MLFKLFSSESGTLPESSFFQQPFNSSFDQTQGRFCRVFAVEVRGDKIPQIVLKPGRKRQRDLNRAQMVLLSSHSYAINMPFLFRAQQKEFGF